MLQQVMNSYINGLITNEQVIQEMLELAKRIQEARQLGQDLGLTEEEMAFYDAEVPSKISPSDIKIEGIVCKEAIPNVEDNTVKLILDGVDRRVNPEAPETTTFWAHINDEIIDKELLNKTGGVVQGMSGSPIMQNNNIVGVVTHVIVDNPLSGYGLFISKMLEEGENKNQ